jgi:DNA-binding transcriptional regulator YiaG
MTNVAQVLKAEITRISRKETKIAVGNVLRSNKGLKKTVADLKKRVAQLEKENKQLVRKQAKGQAASPQMPEEGAKKARLTAKGVRSLRGRLGLTRADFAKLMGTTAHSVYLWETKEGPLKLRGNTKAALLSIRGLRSREAKRRLAEGEGNSKKGRAGAPKKRRAR